LLKPRPAAILLALALLAAVLLPVGTATSSAAGSSTVAAFDAPYGGSPAASGSAVVAITATSTGDGYYVLRADGEVDAYGATSYGSLNAKSLPVGITATGIALDVTTAATGFCPPTVR
jgi:hypothetical protein